MIYTIFKVYFILPVHDHSDDYDGCDNKEHDNSHSGSSRDCLLGREWCRPYRGLGAVSNQLT